MKQWQKVLIFGVLEPGTLSFAYSQFAKNVPFPWFVAGLVLMAGLNSWLLVRAGVWEVE